MSQRTDTVLALTMGEPGGVGPELTARLWLDRKDNKLPPFIYIGESAALLHYTPDLPIKAVQTASEALDVFDNYLPVLELGFSLNIETGVANPSNGKAIIAAIDKAVELTLSGDVAATVTNPIQKSSLYAAGFTAPGHTEYLARLCSMPEDSSVMMLMCEQLKVIPITTHVAINDITKSLTADLIEFHGLITAKALKEQFGISSPRIAVAGLNPHAGEDGMMGLEEAAIINPAIDRLRDAGIDVSGPHAADTLFHSEARSQYDAALCMYHDQALIPVKTLDFHGGVNVTLGLDIIRTSPDHGTALDIAGQNTARTDSLLNAKMNIEIRG